MFDIGFSEILLLLIIGLIVLGPQRLPVAIRTVMGWVHTVRNMATTVQNELSQELKLQELQESIKKAEQFNIDKLSPELNQTVKDLRASAQKIQADLNKGLADTEKTVNAETQKVAEMLTPESTESSTKNETPAEPVSSTPESVAAEQALEKAEADNLVEAPLQGLAVEPFNNAPNTQFLESAVNENIHPDFVARPIGRQGKTDNITETAEVVETANDTPQESPNTAAEKADPIVLNSAYFTEDDLADVPESTKDTSHKPTV